MRNCDARMTGEVHKRFHEQRRNWSVLPKPRSVIAAVAVCVAMYLGTAPTLRAAPQQNISGSNSERVSRAPVITAKPERVTLSDGNGSTEIDWDTGNGSLGFVFVTEDGGKPVLFANGSRGNQVVPWIGKHSYVFELYGDDQRQTLLAKVTVSGSAESASSQQTRIMASCRPLGASHWISSGFVLCGLPQFDWTGTNDISNRAYDVASAAPRCTNPFPRDRCLPLRRRCHLS